MKDPAVLFYTSDFLSGVTFLSMEQRGQYITLLCTQHQHGSIPENHMILICGSLDSPVIKKFEKDIDGTYYNVRMREEADKRKRYSESRSNNKKGKTKTDKNKIISKSYDNHMGNENENENENIIKDINEKIKIKLDQIKSLCKGNFDDILAAFDMWIDYMDKQHGVMLDKNVYTYEVLLDAIKRVGAEKIIESINHSIVCRYKRIFANKDDDYSSNKTKQTTTNVNDKWAEKKRKLGIVG